MILPDWMIRHDVRIEPFAEGIDRPGTISAGLSHYGYDLRVGRKFLVSRVWEHTRGRVVDPKAFDATNMQAVETDVLEIPPGGYALAETVEWIAIPRNCIGMVVDKSTYRRCGILMGATILEPEWKGKVTLEISNVGPLPALVYANEGIAQVIFMRGEAQCLVTYADKRGKYQGQTGLTLPFVAGCAERSV